MSKSLLYFSTVDESRGSKGFLKKIHSQCRAFSKRGYTVFLAVPDNEEFLLYRVSGTETILVSSVKFGERTRGRVLGKLHKYMIMFNQVLCWLDTHKFGIIYVRRFRMSATNFFGIRFLRSLRKKKVISLFEFPTYPYERETLLGRGFMTLILEKLMTSIAMKNIDIIVGVGSKDDVKNLQKKSKLLMISNGTDCDQVKVIPAKKKTRSLVFLGVGAITDYHGYDRLIRGIADFNSRVSNQEKASFHIVGNGEEVKNLRKLAASCKVKEHVVFHGIKTGCELDDLFLESNVAVGSLALHRRGIQRCSPLKTREYCARGIPFIIAYDDIDFPKSFPFLLKLDADDSPIEVRGVLNFYNSLIESNIDYPKEMNNFALANLSWDSRIEVIDDRIKKVISESKEDNLD